jgi:ribose transport system substrate-binding protein
MDQKVILIVEDDTAIAHLLQHVLNEQPGYLALSVPDGHAAVRALAATRIDLLILDMNLPDIDGFTLYDHLHRRPDTAAVPCLFMSARDYRDVLAGRGLHAFLPKPFALETLLTLVGQTLGPTTNAALVAEPA